MDKEGYNSMSDDEGKGFINTAAVKLQKLLGKFSLPMTALIIYFLFNGVWTILYFGILIWNPELVALNITGKIFPTILVGLAYFTMFFFVLLVFFATKSIFTFTIDNTVTAIVQIITIICIGLEISALTVYMVFLFTEPGYDVSLARFNFSNIGNAIAWLFFAFSLIRWCVSIICGVIGIIYLVILIGQVFGMFKTVNFRTWAQFYTATSTNLASLKTSLGLGVGHNPQQYVSSGQPVSSSKMPQTTFKTY